jgi:hypothetical protein
LAAVLDRREDQTTRPAPRGRASINLALRPRQSRINIDSWNREPDGAPAAVRCGAYRAVSKLQALALFEPGPNSEAGGTPGSNASVWRRRRDSNPRCPLGHSGFQDRRLKPLGHSSGRSNVLQTRDIVDLRLTRVGGNSPSAIWCAIADSFERKRMRSWEAWSSSETAVGGYAGNRF